MIMFKTLIATCLMTFSCSGGALHTTNNEVLKNTKRLSDNTLPVLSGGYCFRDDYDLSAFDDVVYLNHTYEVFTNSNYDSSLSRPLILGYDNSTVDYGWADSISIYLGKVSGRVFASVVVSNGRFESTYSANFYSNRGMPEENWVYNFQVYFEYEVSVQPTVYKMFNALFTKSGNAYNRVYSGYYSITNPNVSNLSKFNIFGNILTNNNIYFWLNHGYLGTNTSEVLAFNVTTENGAYDYTNIINNNAIASDSRLLFTNVLINQNYESALSSMGVFNYVYEGSDYDFTDLMYTIADTPIKFLKGLFNVELFGLSLFVAFTSVMTLAIIITIIKKVA